MERRKNMIEEEFKNYFDSIRHTEEFRRLDNFLGITQQTKKIDDDYDFEGIRYYLTIFCNKRESGISFVPDYDYFKKFFEAYREGKPCFRYDDSGYMDLENTVHLRQPLALARGKGYFTDSYIIMTDGTVYIAKIPLNYKGSGVTGNECKYASIIAPYISKELGVSTSENHLARRKDGQFRILSKNFLEGNEELITFFSDDTNFGDQKISEILEILDLNLQLRKFSEEEIESTKLEFLKQEFVAKLIGLKDQKSDNTGIIISTDKEEKRHVRMAPMFDYDYSFHIAEKNDILVRKCDNGKTDIASLIEQYKDYPGFMEFAKKIYELNMNKIFENIFMDTEMREFESCEKDERMKKFIDFTNKNIQMARDILDMINESTRGERE